MMKPDAQIVYCGSDSVIDEDALATALRDGHLGGAALDTFEWEPLTPENPLVPLAREPTMNVLLTPTPRPAQDLATAAANEITPTSFACWRASPYSIALLDACVADLRSQP